MKETGKWPIIYHSFNVSNNFSTLNVQIQPLQNKTIMDNTNLFIAIRYGKLPTMNNCDFIKPLSTMQTLDGFLNWYISNEQINNRQGRWFLGVAHLNSKADETIEENKICQEQDLSKDMLTWDFPITHYNLHTLSGGAYYFNEEIGIWEGSGIKVLDESTFTRTVFETNHLTSFGSGYKSELNSIDFELIFKISSFSDNITVFIFLIICFVFYSIGMIWATCKDLSDKKKMKCIFLEDNHPSCKYIYEMVVETGPLASHANSSKIEFILTGSQGDTGIRTLFNPQNLIFKKHKEYIPFKKGAIDSFILTTDQPLGELNFLRIWTDNSGLMNSNSWYLMKVSVTDIQTCKSVDFIANQWLSIDRGTFEDDITITPTNKEENMTWDYIAKAALTHILNDHHLWLSVFYRPIRSRFNRKERLTTCMASTMLTSLILGLYYFVSQEQILYPFWSLGPVKIDPRDVSPQQFVIAY